MNRELRAATSFPTQKCKRVVGSAPASEGAAGLTPLVLFLPPLVPAAWGGNEVERRPGRWDQAGRRGPQRPLAARARLGPRGFFPCWRWHESRRHGAGLARAGVCPCPPAAAGSGAPTHTPACGPSATYGRAASQSPELSKLGVYTACFYARRSLL